MRRLFTLAALLAVLTVAIFLGTTTTPLFATTCTTTCTYSTLTCTPVNSCTSVLGQSLTCDGTVTTCSAADAWCLCQADCADDCAPACEVGPAACRLCTKNCLTNNCGGTTPPPHTTCSV
jgi:hypothetical protein